MLEATPVQRPAVELDVLVGQTALFDRPDDLLALEIVDLRKLAADVGAVAVGFLAQLRYRVGLLAWAGWHRFSSRDYTEFVAALASDAGVSTRTVEVWRDAQVKDRGLSVPAAVTARKRPERDRCAGQRATFEDSSNFSDPKVIPAASTMAPVQMSGGGPVGEENLPGQRHPPTTPLEVEPEPAAPNTDLPGSPDPAFQRPLNPPELNARPDLTEQAVLVWLQGHRDQEVRAIGSPFRPAWETEIRRWADLLGVGAGPPAPGSSRRQGTISRPEDRVKAEAIVVDPGSCVHPKSSRRDLGYVTWCGVCNGKVA